MSIPSSDLYKTLILGAKAPFVIKSFNLPWHCMQTTLEEWCNQFKNDSRYDAGVIFETGKLFNNKYPQWERCRQPMRLTLAEFLEQFHESPNTETWAAYSYKHLKYLPNKCSEGVSFATLGFEDQEDISFWLGSKGAHTSCHYDTYGCNIVVQVYGRKLWILFPPNTPLTASRVPYEESSVYCEQNLFSPSDFSNFQEVKEKAFCVTLNPGDILIVPPKWWHYVENLETALSINTWIPLETDLEGQFEECIVKNKIIQLTQNLPDCLKRAIINPNEMENLYCSTLQQQLKLLENLALCILNIEARTQLLSNVKAYSSSHLTDAETCNLQSKVPNHRFEAVSNISSESFLDILKVNKKRFRRSLESSIEQSPDYINIVNLINIECSTAVINLLKSMWLEKFSKYKLAK